MRIADLAKVSRTGPLIDQVNNRPELLGGLANEALAIEREGLQFQAASVSAAAAWLFTLAHANALGAPFSQPPRSPASNPSPFEINRLIGFRGQRGKYAIIIPTLFRKSQAERKLHDQAFQWFHAAISAWHNTYFYYLDGSLDPGGVENDTAIGVAQHFGIGTFLVDWTWDPIIAIAFAIAELSPGEDGAVYLRDFGAGERPSSTYNVLLPPPFAARVWRQRGFFAWQPVPPEFWDDPIVKSMIGRVPEFTSTTSNYHRVVFKADSADIAWAKEMVASLYKEDQTLCLSDLTRWCLETVSRGHEIGRQSDHLMDVRDFAAECEKRGIDLPLLLRGAPDPKVAHERVSEMMDYIELVALRRHPDGERLAYYIPALLTVTCGMPWKSFPLEPGAAAAAEDARAGIFASNGVRTVDVWADKLRFWEAVRPDYDLFNSLFVERSTSD